MNKSIQENCIEECCEHEHHHHEECCEHEHHHHEECCEHEHHHHEECCEHGHHHKECCEHEHSIDEEHVNKEYGIANIGLSHHDGAAIVSGKLYLLGDSDEIERRLETKMEIAAKNLNEAGAIIGHIKASFENKKIKVLSVTDKYVTKNKAPDDEIAITVAAIIFLVEDEFVIDTIRDMLTEL